MEILKFAKKEDGTYSVYAGDKENMPKHLEIPSSYEGIPVTAIGRGGFQYCKIQSVTIPESVTEIGAFAFRKCTSLSEIRLPDSLRQIGEWAFSDTALESAHEKDEAFYIGNNLIGARPVSDVFAIRKGTRTVAACIAYENEWNAKTVTIPASVVAISDGAFATAYDFSDDYTTEAFVVDPANHRYYYKGNCLIEKCTKRVIAGCGKSVIPVGVTSIGKMAFMDSGIKSVTIPEGVSSIERSAFMECYDLSEVTLPDSLKTIGENAFSGCGIRDLCIPDSVTKIGKGCFSETDLESLKVGSGLSEIPDFAFDAFEVRGCPLQQVTIPGNVKRIGSSAFSQCNNLQTVRLEEGVEDIDEFAFFNDQKLSEVTLPKTLKSITGNAFDMCVSLNEIKYAGTSDEWKAVTKAEDWCGERQIPVVCKDETVI